MSNLCQDIHLLTACTISNYNLLQKSRIFSVLSTTIITESVILTITMELTKTDLQLLRLLQQDCRQPITEIAKEMGIPVTTAYDKVRRMEERGIIKGYAALLNEAEVNFRTTALILVSVGYPPRTEFSQEQVAERLAAFEEITEIYIIAGDWDLMLKIKSQSIEDIGDFVIKQLRNIEGIAKTKTIAVFRKVKETVSLPI